MVAHRNPDGTSPGQGFNFEGAQQLPVVICGAYGGPGLKGKQIGIGHNVQ